MITAGDLLFPQFWPSDCALATLGPQEDPALEVFEEELICLSPRAAPKRHRDLMAGRAAARRALKQLGGPQIPIPKGPGGAPIWPPGWRGSLSHTEGVAVALVGPAERYQGLGMDIEYRQRRIHKGVISMVCTPKERLWVEGPGWSERLLTLFSAKEAIFKAFYPIESCALGFMDAQLQFEKGSFQGELLAAASKRHLPGFRFTVLLHQSPGLLLSALILSRNTPSEMGISKAHRVASAACCIANRPRSR